jgi:hypothetical protein
MSEEVDSLVYEPDPLWLAEVEHLRALRTEIAKLYIKTANEPIIWEPTKDVHEQVVAMMSSQMHLLDDLTSKSGWVAATDHGTIGLPTEHMQ